MGQQENDHKSKKLHNLQSKLKQSEEKISKDESSREQLTNTNKEVNDLNKSIKSQLKDSQRALDKLQDELKKANLELNKKEQLIKKFENRQTDFENRNFEQNIASQSISAIERIRQGSGSEIISMGQPSLLSSVQLDDCDVNELPISPSKCFPNSVSSYKSNTSLLTTGKNNNITNLRNNYSNHNKYDDNNSDNRYEIDKLNFRIEELENLNNHLHNELQIYDNIQLSSGSSRSSAPFNLLQQNLEEIKNLRQKLYYSLEKTSGKMNEILENDIQFERDTNDREKDILQLEIDLLKSQMKEKEKEVEQIDELAKETIQLK